MLCAELEQNLVCVQKGRRVRGTAECVNLAPDVEYIEASVAHTFRVVNLQVTVHDYHAVIVEHKAVFVTMPVL